MLFANFAEAIAEGRGKAQADALRSAKKDVDAFKIASPDNKEDGKFVSASQLHPGDFVLVRAGEQIPADGDVVRQQLQGDDSQNGDDEIV